METTIEEIQCYFINFNEEYFDNKLPMPVFRIIHSYDTLGYFDYQTTYGSPSRYRISITDGYWFTYEQLRDIIVHEMIHFYLVYTGQDMKVSHDERFLNLANELNNNFGLDINITYDTTQYFKIKQNNTWLKIKDYIKGFFKK